MVILEKENCSNDLLKELFNDSFTVYRVLPQACVSDDCKDSGLYSSSANAVVNHQIDMFFEGWKSEIFRETFYACGAKNCNPNAEVLDKKAKAQFKKMTQQFYRLLGE